MLFATPGNDSRAVKQDFVRLESTRSFINVASGTDTLFLKNNILAGAKTGGLIIGTATVLDSSNNVIQNIIANVGFMALSDFYTDMLGYIFARFCKSHPGILKDYLSLSFIRFKNKDMTIKIVPFALILAFSLVACKSDAPSNTPPTEPMPTEIIPTAEPAATLGSTPDAAIQTATPANATAGKAGMKNPAHGEPGHVCGKPVGSILDGTEAPTTQAAPTTATAKPAAAPAGATPAGGTTTVAPGSNPPHGQPGHRCDIAVGAPLDSKPKQ